jgi:hypothetical protein
MSFGGSWLPWPGTVYAVPQYPAVPVLRIKSKRMNMIGYKLRGGRPLNGKLRMSAFRRCVDDPEKMVDPFLRRAVVFYHGSLPWFE